MSIGIQLAGKEDRLLASVFIRSFENFLELLKDIDSAVSHRKTGSVRWEIAALSRNSPALAEMNGTSRLRAGDYTQTVQYSVIEGLYQLGRQTPVPELPENYSYSALQKVRAMASQAKRLTGFNVFTGTQETAINQQVRTNVEYLIGTGGVSLGSLRGSLDAITVHSGHEFRIWPSKLNSKKPIACRFTKAMLPEVISHIKNEVEVFGKIRRNSKGTPVFMTVEQFVPFERPSYVPSIGDVSGLINDLYGGLTLGRYMEDLRDG